VDIKKLVSQYVAPLDIAGHPTGGAIDVTLIENGNELFLGTVYNAAPELSENKTYMNSNKITDEEKKLREILAEVMESAGFINYTPEWWHWSYGDKYWSYITKKPVKYNRIEDQQITRLITVSI
jgi:D-alanyl-D-alanine dipeptidase